MNHMSAAMEEVSTQLLTVSRSEQKYVLSHADAAALRERISRVLVRDAHGGDAGYPVRSLYFDSLNQRDYTEKLAGVEVRRKIRLRTYDADAPSCKLEIKKKRGAHSEKLSVTVSRREAEALSSGDYSPLLHRLDNVREAGIFYETMALGCYRPTVLVTYNRLAFVHPAGDTRITFDSDIRASEGVRSLYDEAPFMVPVLRDAIVLEVKYNEVLPEQVAKVLRPFQLTQTAFSKYSESRPLYRLFDG